MKKTLKAVRSSFSVILLAGAQISVLVAVVVSQAGERLVRGPRGFEVYRDTATEQA